MNFFVANINITKNVSQNTCFLYFFVWIYSFIDAIMLLNKDEMRINMNNSKKVIAFSGSRGSSRYSV